MSKPKISVIIPTLNSARFVGEAIDSVLKQSVPVCEILVVDGGSTDGTVEIVRTKSELVQVLTQEGHGRAGARNTGLRQASGDYIALLDSDDLWIPDKLANQIYLFQKYPKVEMVFGDMALFTCDQQDTPEILDKKIYDYLRCNPVNPQRMMECLFTVNFIPTSSVIFKKSCLQKVGYMAEEFSHCEDYEYWLRFAANSQIGYLQQTLVRRRMHDANAMKNAYAQNCEALLQLFNQWRKKSGLTRESFRILLRRIASIQYDLSSHLIKHGLFLEGYKHLREIQNDNLEISIALRAKIFAKTALVKLMIK